MSAIDNIIMRGSTTKPYRWNIFTSTPSLRMNTEKGLSLVELLVAIVVIGLLIAIIVPLDAAHRKEALKASVQSDVRHTNANIINSLNENPKAEGFMLVDPTATASGDKFTVETVSYQTAASGEPVKVYVVASENNQLIVTDVSIDRPLDATGDGAWNAYQITGTSTELPGYYYTFISTIGEYRENNPDTTSGGGEPGGEEPVAGPPTPETPIAPITEGVMVTTWDTSIPNCSQIYLPFTGESPGSTIDWGDGVIEPTPYGLKSHTYSSDPGVKTVIYKGKMKSWGSPYNDYHSNRCLLRVDKWENTGVTNLAGAFYGATSLTHVPAIPETTTNLSRAFFNAVNFNGDISKWNVSNVTTMADMFANAKAFQGDLSAWDVSKVSDFSSMFAATLYNQPLNSWNTSSAVTMNSMFLGSPKFNQPLSNWNTSNVTNMGNMFGGAKLFNQPLGSWDTSNVTTFRAMFNDARVFSQPLNTWNTSKATDMNRMFSGAGVFNQPLNNWDTSNVTDMGSMFYNNQIFSQDISSWNVIKVGAKHTSFTSATPTYFPASKMPKWTA